MLSILRDYKRILLPHVQYTKRLQEENIGYLMPSILRDYKTRLKMLAYLMLYFGLKKTFAFPSAHPTTIWFSFGCHVHLDTLCREKEACRGRASGCVRDRGDILLRSMCV